MPPSKQGLCHYWASTYAWLLACHRKLIWGACSQWKYRLQTLGTPHSLNLPLLASTCWTECQVGSWSWGRLVVKGSCHWRQTDARSGVVLVTILWCKLRNQNWFSKARWRHGFNYRSLKNTDSWLGEPGQLTWSFIYGARNELLSCQRLW